jgi:hypothetical protein
MYLSNISALQREIRFQFVTEYDSLVTIPSTLQVAANRETFFKITGLCPRQNFEVKIVCINAEVLHVSCWKQICVVTDILYNMVLEKGHLK